MDSGDGGGVSYNSGTLTTGSVGGPLMVPKLGRRVAPAIREMIFGPRAKAKRKKRKEDVSKRKRKNHNS